MIVYSKYLPKGVRGFMLYPLVVINSRDYNIIDMLVIRMHEKIHKKQAEETWILGFYLLYLYELIVGLFKYGNLYKAYMSIRFEKEAYKHQGNINYFGMRKRNVWKDL